LENDKNGRKIWTIFLFKTKKVYASTRRFEAVGWFRQLFLFAFWGILPEKYKKESRLRGDKMRVLVVNDDGIYARGIRVLANALRTISDVVVVAPDRQKSAAGHSLTINECFSIKKVEIEKDFNGITVVDGTPTDCVLVGVKDITKDNPPDFVISGINQGANLGGDILYSGTVAGALEGLVNGFKSIAISLDTNRDDGHFDTAAKVALKILEKKELLDGIVEERSILNVNVPNVPL